MRPAIIAASACLMLFAPAALAATPWSEIRPGVETKPFVVTIGHPTTIRWQVPEHPAFAAVVLDRDLHPRIAAAYEKFAGILGVAGDPLYVVMTPHLAPFAASTDPTFLGDVAARWATEPNQLVTEAGRALRRYLIADPESGGVTTISRSGTALQRYDPIGGGVFRRVGEFDKGLHDQTAFVLERLDSKEARVTLDYVISEFQDAGGAFVAGLRADSLVPRDGSPVVIEGGHYQWTFPELQHLLGARHAEVFAFHYGMVAEYNVPLLPRDRGETMARFSLTTDELEQLLDAARARLYDVRSKRPDPRRHELFITEYNGRMISALTRAGYRDVAVRASHAILKRNLAGGKLMRADDVPALPEDYSAMIRALLDLYDVTFDPSFIERAIELQELADASSPPAVPDPVALLAPKIADELAPRNIVELAAITGDPHWIQRAGDALTAHRQVIIAGNPSRDETNALLQAARASNDPQTIFLIGSRRIRARLETWMPYVKDIVEIEKQPVAAICRAGAGMMRGRCTSPTFSLP